MKLLLRLMIRQLFNNKVFSMYYKLQENRQFYKILCIFNYRTLLKPLKNMDGSLNF